MPPSVPIAAIHAPLASDVRRLRFCSLPMAAAGGTFAGASRVQGGIAGWWRLRPPVRAGVASRGPCRPPPPRYPLHRVSATRCSRVDSLLSHPPGQNYHRLLITLPGKNPPILRIHSTLNKNHHRLLTTTHTNHTRAEPHDNHPKPIPYPHPLSAPTP